MMRSIPGPSGSTATTSSPTWRTNCYLSRKFRKETGKGLTEYIDPVRIEKAKTLLLGTDDSIASIASRLRYCSGTCFSEIFRRREGMLPSEYRSRKRK